MRIGVFFPTKEHGTVDEMVARFAALRDEGFSSGWLPQSMGLDAITLLAIVGREVDGLELGTSVVPTFPRHPISLAAQALTTNAASGGRFCLGIGLSHKGGIEGRYGLSYDKPARHMREYLSVLMPLLADQRSDFEGETLMGKTELTVAGATAPPVLLAALQPLMLKLAGTMADGTITWCTGPVTLEEQIVPIIGKAAADAGRPEPRIVVALPAIVTNDETDGRTKAGLQLEGYENIPVYRAVLDREGVQGPADISVVGDEASFAAQVKRLEEIGATDFVAIPCGTPEERDRTRAYLASLNP